MCLGDELTVAYVAARNMTGRQRAEKHALQVGCFAVVPSEEIFEYFVAEPVGSVLAWIGDEMVGCVSVFERTITVDGAPVRLGGYGGTCTRADLRGRGIGSRVCAAAMEELRRLGCEVAMLAVDPGGATDRFYARQGFRKLGRPFEIVTASGRRVRPDDVAMLAPVGSEAVFRRVLDSREPLFLGPEAGYW